MEAWAADLVLVPLTLGEFLNLGQLIISFDSYRIGLNLMASKTTEVTLGNGQQEPGGSNRDGASHGAGSPAKVGTFHALSIPSYRWLWTSNIFSSAGMWVQMATLGWVIYDLTASGALLGAINGMRAIPMLLFTPLAGLAADRVNRRKLMMTTNFIVIIVSAILGIGLIAGKIEVWHLFVFALVGGTVQVFNMPVQQTVVFDLVPRNVIPNAVALGSAAFNVTSVIGPGIAGFFIAWWGPGVNFLLQSAAFIAVILCLKMITFPERKASRQPRASMANNMLDGVKYVSRDRIARTLVILAVIPSIFIMPSMMALAPIFAKDIFHSGPNGLGLLMSAMGLGGFLGALFAASIGHFERRGLLQLAMLSVAGTALLLFSISSSLVLALPMMAIAGFAQMTYMTNNQTILQLSVPDHMRGRVTSLFMLNMALMPISAIVLGSLTDAFGAPHVVMVSSVLVLSITVLMAIFVPAVRNMRMSELSSANRGAVQPPAGVGV